MKNNWILLLIVLGVFFLSLMGWSFYLANSGGARVTDKNYTKHGHQYAAVDKEITASGKLGWKINCEKKGKRLVVLLSQEDGKPVSGAEGLIEFLSPGSGTPLLAAAMQEIETGLYIVDLPIVEGKELNGILSMKKGAALLRKRMMIIL